MKSKKLTFLIILLCAISVGYFIFIIVNPHGSNKHTEHTVVESTTEAPTTTESPNIIFTENASVSDATNSDAITLPPSHEINLEYVSQYPDLPSGCESVSLTMLLNYNGFDITKNELVDNYLIYSYDYVHGFCGDPYSSYVGGGCYAPGMTDTANKYLSSQNSDLIARNLTGKDFDDLLYYVASNKPVMVWTTIGLGYCEKSYEGGYYEGAYYSWDYMEHCVVIAGYDTTNRTLTIYDPIDGIVTRDYDTFKDIYDQMYKMAIVIE